MEYFDKEFTLEVWGPIACFTRPELKVERVSYDVITPSAARAIFEAIFWKPAIRWQVTRIEVLNDIKWTSVRRNEVGAVAGKTPIIIEDNKRQQKNTLMLKDVRYRISAKLVFIPKHDRKYGESKNPEIDQEEQNHLHRDENPGKYNAMFERRAAKGQCFNQPYLGTRECAASFRLIYPETDLLDAPIQESRDLGIMLYDMDFAHNNEKPEAMFYRAKMEYGVIQVPELNSEEVLR
ncbi:type I-C CRISPR-associated protein Cas5c [Bacteroides heparinolyticus]|uniref:type I-C CRISPR-associated protein Cas5c n=1 Tax=Prevotella heparinolytica TaxID=28113 RepID=UPI0035A14C64